MIKSDAKLKKLTELLNANNKKLIIDAIDILREEQPFEGAIGLLVSLYDSTGESDLIRSVENFMNDIKDQSAIPEVISEIKHGWKPATTRMLVSSCWQSGLDYSSYIQDITEIFLKSDYATAIECFSVIGESVHNLGKTKKKELTKLINNHIKSLDADMIRLTDELKTILEAE